jgi:ribosome biogenesis protein UTP30
MVKKIDKVEAKSKQAKCVKGTKGNKENTKVEKAKSKNKVEEEIVEDHNIYTEHEENNLQEDLRENYNKQVEIVKENLQLNKKQVSKAVKCLKKIVLDKYKDNKNLLADEKDEFLYLNFIFSRLPYKYSVRPVNIPLSHSLYDKSYGTTVCLFVKDPSSDFKDLAIDFPFKVKVIDVQKLKLKYSRFQERRNLVKQFDIFLCDFKIYMLLKKLLGKPFYTAKKYPIPIKLDYSNKDSITHEVVSQVENCTTYYMTHGPNYSVKISRVVMEDEESVENIMAAVTGTLPHILKWGINLEE